MEVFEFVNASYLTLAAIVGGVVIATRLREQLHETRKDLEALEKQLERRDTYITVMRLEADHLAFKETTKSQITELWQFSNKTRDRQDDFK